MDELLLQPRDDVGRAVALDRHVARRGDEDPQRQSGRSVHRPRSRPGSSQAHGKRPGLATPQAIHRVREEPPAASVKRGDSPATQLRRLPTSCQPLPDTSPTAPQAAAQFANMLMTRRDPPARSRFPETAPSGWLALTFVRLRRTLSHVQCQEIDDSSSSAARETLWPRRWAFTATTRL